MIGAFRALRERHPAARGWRLALVGSVNHDIEENVEHLRRVTASAAGLPVEILPNAPLERVKATLAEASIFWHFTGLGEDEADTPERLEHFGIVVVEAMMNNCWPIVFNGGGPTEIVEAVKYGEAGSDLDELVEKTARAIQRLGHSGGPAPVNRELLVPFSQDQLEERLLGIIKNRAQSKKSSGWFGRTSEIFAPSRKP
jgi:glycosyltransferase involved in cell wall biosynthesis